MIFHKISQSEYNKIADMIGSENVRRRNRNPSGYVIAAFGTGVLIKCCFPSSFVVCLIAVLIIIVGILISKC